MGTVLILVIIIISSGIAFPDFKEDCAYDDIIIYHSARNNLDPFLIKAIIKVESDFDPDCISSKGAKGLMQLMPSTAKMQGSTRMLHHPDTNIAAGTRHLAILFSKYHNNLDLVLAAYNAGILAVSKYKGVPPYTETRSFIKVVKKYHKHYKSNGYMKIKKVYSFIDSKGVLHFFNE